MNVEPVILCVDDRPENLLALERTLVDTGARLVRAASGEEALAATLHKEFALAILDVQMPGMDGYELAGLLRGDPKTKRMPIIFLTAFSSGAAQVFKGYESGAVDYIVKPYVPEILLSKVNVFLELYTQRVELDRQRDRLEDLNNELKTFAYSVSHDLRAPLRAIAGFSEALIEDCQDKLDETEQDYLRRVVAEAGRMSELIDGLLVLSRVTRAELRLSRVSLSDLAEELLSRSHHAEPQREVELVVAEGLVVDGDSRLLRQVLDNLLSNAWKFTGHEAKARVEVGRVETGGSEAFFVRDNGVGLDTAYSDKLFTPFQRLHKSSEFPGTGIGLSTVRKIVTRHGGRIWCESEVGVGTTFFFTLPKAGKI